MKIIEEKNLKTIITKLNKFANSTTSMEDFYSKCDSIASLNLQDASFKQDLKFFDEISFILSVITSIINHPHISNKGEDIIIRTELASSVTPDMFKETLKDVSLWRENNYEMTPEYVHYYQSVDEIRIYENIFIVNLIKLIDNELAKYTTFYSSMISILDDEFLSLKNDFSNLALKEIRLINRKIKHIKDTSFYKIVNKFNTKLSTIYPTNILLKDRLYNYCFRFYKKISTYLDNFERRNDLRKYYFIKIIKYLKDNGYSLIENASDYIESKLFIIPDVKLENDNFEIIISTEESHVGLILEIKNKKAKKKYNSSKHLLLVDDTFNDENKSKVIINEVYDTIEIMTLWNLYEFNDLIINVFESPTKENAIVSRYIDTKLSSYSASIDIYSDYCPSCKSQAIDYVDDLYTCSSCSSKYTFYKENKADNLWFIRLRRL